MAKALSPKSALIRSAIKAHPNLKNKELAQLLSGHADRKRDGIKGHARRRGAAEDRHEEARRGHPGRGRHQLVRS
jgi:hypothetical protein